MKVDCRLGNRDDKSILPLCRANQFHKRLFLLQKQWGTIHTSTPDSRGIHVIVPGHMGLRTFSPCECLPLGRDST